MKSIEFYEKIPENDFPIILGTHPFGSYTFSLHWHEHIEIQCVFEGSAELRCGEDVVRLEAGECAVINGNELHMGVGGECSYAHVIIPPEFFGDNHVIFQRVIRDERLFEMLGRIFDEYREFDRVSSLSLTGYTYLMIAFLMKEYSHENLSETGYRSYYEKLEKINKAIQHIEENFTENVTTRALAEMVHLSEGHFCHLFKEVTGKSAKEYMLQLRIKKAKNLLTSSGMSITEICYTCGFSDPNYFTRIFKKKTGSSPSFFRKE